MNGHFSNRLPLDLSTSSFFKSVELEKQKKHVDLSLSSPWHARILDESVFDEIILKNPFQSADEAVKKVISEYYKGKGALLDPNNIVLCSGTSEAYSILFKVFCDPGDTILVQKPGYPLLENLARLEGLKTYPYFLKKPKTEASRFEIDVDSLISAPFDAKILMLVSPHNPTGHVLSRGEWRAILEFCKERDLVLIVDEVFADYSFVLENFRFEALQSEVSVFCLNGLSKTIGNPDLKLSWIAYQCPPKRVEKLRNALEYVVDAYLTCSAFAKVAASKLLPQVSYIQKPVLERLYKNLELYRKYFPLAPIVEGSWYASLYLGCEDDALFCLRLLRESRVWVQPGFLFDWGEGWIVLSLLVETQDLEYALQEIQKMNVL